MSSIKLPQLPRDLDVITVPIPPSTNNLFRNANAGGRIIRVKSSEYKAWLQEVESLFRRLKQPEALPVEVELVVLGKLNRQRDLDNMLKPIGDALVAFDVLPGDNLVNVVRWDVRYEPDEGEARLEVFVWPPEELSQTERQDDQ